MAPQAPLGLDVGYFLFPVGYWLFLVSVSPEGRPDREMPQTPMYRRCAKFRSSLALRTFSAADSMSYSIRLK